MTVRRFSERVAGQPPPASGLEEATPGLRTALWNVLHEVLFPAKYLTDSETSRQRVRALWDHIGMRIDEAPYDGSSARLGVSQIWFKCAWQKFFDILEFSARLLASDRDSTRGRTIYDDLNAVLEQQGCAYRFISGQLAPLTNPTEMAEVARATQSAVPSASAHISEALKLLPPNKDASPRNSVKESISAVEGALKHLTQQPSATLTDGLAAFEARYGTLHPALRGGLVKLYGYTSDEKGVRHALVDEQANVTIGGRTGRLSCEEPPQPGRCAETVPMVPYRLRASGAAPLFRCRAP
jgi:AbiJ N-terminal domain 4